MSSFRPTTNIPGMNDASGPYARSNVAQAPPSMVPPMPAFQPATNNANASTASAKSDTSLFADSPLSQYIDSPLGMAATSYGQQFIGNNRFIKGSLQNYETFRQMKYYFDVNNSYVLNKLSLVLFPLQQKTLKRRVHRQGDGDVYLPPRDDINAPDLYIPTMAFVSYVLVVAFLMGEAWSFSPEAVGQQFSSSLMALVFEVAFFKAGFYFLSNVPVSSLDVVAYCGYKYVGITLSVLVGFLIGATAYYVLLFATSLSMAVFLVKTFRLVAPAALANGAASNARNYFLLAAGLSQPVLFYLLGHLVAPAAAVVAASTVPVGSSTAGSI